MNQISIAFDPSLENTKNLELSQLLKNNHLKVSLICIEI